MRKRYFGYFAAAAAVLSLTLSGCGGGQKSYADGTYEAQSFVYENEDGSDEGNGYGVVTITIKDGAISDCTFKTFETDGTPKDAEYGKADGAIANQDFYNKAQKAVGACDEYARMLVEEGGTIGVDVISGATVNYEEFLDAVSAALKQAEK